MKCDRFILEDRNELFRLYWDELMDQIQIGKMLRVHHATVTRAMKRLKIPIRTRSDTIRLNRNGGRDLTSHKNPYWKTSDGSYEHVNIMEKILGRPLSKKERVHHKDFCGWNNHPENLELSNTNDHSKRLHKNLIPDRIPIFEIYMRMAEQVSLRSSCIRLKTGAVIVSSDLTQVYSIGFNGSVKGWVNSCNGIEGKCGCLHAEENALLKVRIADKNKVLFCTDSPCMDCAKKLIQSGFSDVFYRREYRDKKPIVFLHYHGIRTCRYDLYKDHVWN